MDATGVQTAIEGDYETELSRLGSSKALYAITEGEMEEEVVLRAIADRILRAAETFESWASTVPSNDIATALATLAESQHSLSAQVAETGDGDPPRDELWPLDATLRELEEPAELVGGLVAWGLITDRTLSQAVGFFVGNADPQTADRMREVRSATGEQVENMLDAFDSVDEDTAIEAAGNAIEAAYGHYVDVLEGMGVKVKPVC